MLRIDRCLSLRVPQASLRPRPKSHRRAPRFETFIWNLQGCIVVYLSRCIAVFVSCDSFVIIPPLQALVNNFFQEIFYLDFSLSKRLLQPRFQLSASATKLIVSPPHQNVNTQFQNFSTKYHNLRIQQKKP